MKYISNEILRAEISRAIKKTAEERFDFYVNEGWFTLDYKKVKKVSGAIVENYKTGKEFGTHFANAVDRILGDFLTKQEKANEEYHEKMKTGNQEINFAEQSISE